MNLFTLSAVIEYVVCVLTLLIRVFRFLWVLSNFYEYRTEYCELSKRLWEIPEIYISQGISCELMPVQARYRLES
jgi:hypothetical protein